MAATALRTRCSRFTCRDNDAMAGLNGEIGMTRKVSLSTGAAALAVVLAIAASAQSQTAAPLGSWTMKAPLPRTWTEIVAVPVNDKLYALSTNFPAEGGVDEYDP